MSAETLADLEDHLLLFFTGYSRSASSILADQKKRSESSDASMIANLDRVNDLGRRIGSALESGDTMEFAALMDEHWTYKRQRSVGITNTQIDDWYTIARNNGALGGKLVGAGAAVSCSSTPRIPAGCAQRWRTRGYRRFGSDSTTMAPLCWLGAEREVRRDRSRRRRAKVRNGATNASRLAGSGRGAPDSHSWAGSHSPSRRPDS